MDSNLAWFFLLATRLTRPVEAMRGGSEI